RRAGRSWPTSTRWMPRPCPTRPPRKTRIRSRRCSAGSRSRARPATRTTGHDAKRGSRNAERNTTNPGLGPGLFVPYAELVMLDPATAVRNLEATGFTHVVWIPDSALGPWEAALASSTKLKLIRPCREGEAIGVAAGLLLGGARPVVVIQCTGLF